MDRTTFKQRFEIQLAAWLTQKESEMPTVEAQQMVRRIQRLILRAGKRSRPSLLQLTYGAYGGKNDATISDIGIALEIHHQFLLVHDDIMDNDTVRYDGPNLIGYYQGDYLANGPAIPASMALLGGDLLYTFASQAILEITTITDSQKVRLLRLMHDVNISVIAGQQLDIVNIYTLQAAVTKEKLLITDRLKTAMYSIYLPMQIAAELLELSAAERSRISDFANSFGVMYQLVDDHSDFFENSSSFNNHPKYRDFREGKVTLPLLYGLQHTQGADLEFLQKGIGKKDLSDDAMKRVASILDDCGAKNASQEVITNYSNKAKIALETLNIDDKAKQPYLQLIAQYSAINTI